MHANCVPKPVEQVSKPPVVDLQGKLFFLPINIQFEKMLIHLELLTWCSILCREEKKKLFSSYFSPLTKWKISLSIVIVWCLLKELYLTCGTQHVNWASSHCYRQLNWNAVNVLVQFALQRTYYTLTLALHGISCNLHLHTHAHTERNVCLSTRIISIGTCDCIQCVTSSTVMNGLSERECAFY